MIQIWQQEFKLAMTDPEIMFGSFVPLIKGMLILYLVFLDEMHTVKTGTVETFFKVILDIVFLDWIFAYFLPDFKTNYLEWQKREDQRLNHQD